MQAYTYDHKIVRAQVHVKFTNDIMNSRLYVYISLSVRRDLRRILNYFRCGCKMPSSYVYGIMIFTMNINIVGPN